MADSANRLPWWKTSIIYQIYPRSFKDFNGSGTGDLKGITTKIDYLKDIGIGAVWLSPCYPSPMADFGYDISNYVDIEPIFGTLEDFDELKAALKDKGIKLMMDFVPNHTSDQHDWFLKSIKKIDPFADYYIWKDPVGYDKDGRPIPPNNWLSVFRFSAWEWNEERKQFYFHQYLKEQPDLNVRNPVVMDELDKVVRFWLDRGVDGLRVDAIQRLFEVEDVTLNEPIAENSGVTDPLQYEYLDHIYTKNLPETVDAVRRWRKICDEYEDRMIMVEASDMSKIMEVIKYYGKPGDPVAHFPFNFNFITHLKKRNDVTGTNLKTIINKWMDYLPEGKWPNWVIGNHDNPRIANRVGADLIDAFNMLVLLLPGTPTIYYGEEIGMVGPYVTFEQTQDPHGKNFGPDRYKEFSRDPGRSPMQWDDSQNAGFSTALATWLPIHENYKTLNVASQIKTPQSHLKVFTALAKLRQENTFTQGKFDYCMATEDLFAFVRYLEGEPTYLVIINTAASPITANLTEQSAHSLPQDGVVELRSIFDEREKTKPGSRVALNSVSLLPAEGLVIKLL